MRARPEPPPSPTRAAQAHLARLRDIVDMESRHVRVEAERAARDLDPAAAEEAGLVIRGLEVADEDAGAGARTVVALTRARGLPRDGFRVGECARIDPPAGADADEARPVSGVVARRSDERLCLMLDGDPPDWLYEGRHSLHRVPDDVTARRMTRALEAASSVRTGRLADLRDLLAGTDDARAGVAIDLPAAFAEGLDASQRRAVARALAAPDFHLIHGPPGTGKTTALVALVRAAVAGGSTVLCAAPSNAAVDVLAERLDRAGLRVVRIGHPARTDPAVLASTLDARTREHPDAIAARRLFREAREVRKRLSGGRRRLAREERQALRDEVRGLVRDARRLAEQAEGKVIGEAQAVCATLTGTGIDALADRTFDLVVIDEAAQALEPACWIALARARRVVLAGDHCQLPPVVVSPEAAAKGLAVTLFERLHHRFGETQAAMLTVQYRMHEAIAAFSNARFYEGRLVAAAANAAHRLPGLPGIEAVDPWTEAPLLVIDTAGTGFDEERPEGSPSLRNPGEADAVCRVVERLYAAGVRPDQVGIIAPYAAQVACIRDRLAAASLTACEVDSADGFQGREREAIVLSLTRSNPDQDLGFLTDYRRMNVAMTRARRFLCVLGDSATVAADPFYAALLDHAESVGALTNAWALGLVE